MKYIIARMLAYSQVLLVIRREACVVNDLYRFIETIGKRNPTAG